MMDKVKVAFPLLLLLVVLNTSEGAFINLKMYEYDWLRQTVSDKLNIVNVRPTIMNTTEPIEISVSMTVRNFGLINDKTQEYSIQITLRQEWEDDRLAYAKFNPVQLRQIKYLTLTDTDKIWTPDLFFKNEVKSFFHSMMKPNTYARIYANGTVLLDTRLSLTLSCPMNFRFFPFDSQTCTVRLASYAFARDDLIYKWKPAPHPITIGQDATHGAEFVFDTVNSNYCDSQSGIGVYSCLLAEFHFHRSKGFYLKQVFIPMANLVTLAWFSFLLDCQQDKTFLLRGIICLSALAMSFSLLSNSSTFLPKAPYNTAMEVWTGISLTFIFSALVEFVLVHYLMTHEFEGFGKPGTAVEGSVKSSKRNSTSEEMEMGRVKGIEGSLTIEPEEMNGERKKSVEVQTHWTKKLVPEKIEWWARVAYPSAYLAFNLLFWLVCSNSGDDHR